MFVNKNVCHGKGAQGWSLYLQLWYHQWEHYLDHDQEGLITRLKETHKYLFLENLHGKFYFWYVILANWRRASSNQLSLESKMSVMIEIYK